jgi:hypothetical protein
MLGFTTFKQSAILGVLGLLIQCGGWAQTGQGTIVGTVNDSTGAVVPSVVVRVTNAETNVAATSVSNESGLYRVPYLNPGMYMVAFEAQGFKRLERTSIQVRTSETIRVDAVLEVGNVVESVQVSAATSLLETETSATGHLVAGAQLNKLPTPQMKIESMMWYVPGVTSQGGFGHVAGSRSRAFNMTNDGVSGTNPGNGTVGLARNMSPPEHNVQEVKILTTTLPAEYGHSGGGVMSITYKSGTNQLHGLAEERYEPKNFIHRRWEDQRPSEGAFGYHLMSGQLSGPIVLPKLYNGRNRTFFLYGFQRHHEKASENAFADVPNQAMLNGDFSFGGIGDIIYDPNTLTRLADGSYSRTPFANNRIPLDRIDPAIQKFLSLEPYQRENSPATTFVNRTGPHSNYNGDTRNRSYRTAMDWKVDHAINDNHRIYGRLSYFRHRSPGRPQIHVLNPIFDNVRRANPTNQYQFMFDNMNTLSPTVVNEIRIGVNRRKFSEFHPSFDQNWAGQLGIPNVPGTTMPDFRNATGGNIFINMPKGRQQDVNESVSLQENLTIIRGRHTFKTGYELLRTRINSAVPAQPSGVYRFGGTEFPFRPNTGHPFASLLLGSVVSAEFTLDAATWLPRWWSHALYFQDDWKVTPKLTLNLGLRYQYESPFSTKWNQQSQFSPDAIDPLTGRKGALLHPAGNLAGKDWNNFQPRIGVAYSVTDKLVFRGGFAVNTLDLWSNGLRENFDEYLATALVAREPGNPDISFYLRNGPGSINYNIAPDGSVPYVGSNFQSRTASWYDPNMRMPYIMNWNGGVQYQLTGTSMVEMTYQGSAGIGLLNSWNINTVPLNISTDPVALEQVRRAEQNFKPYPHFGNITHYSNYGHSTFHSGTIKFEQRYSRGLSFVSFYTYSKSLDEASADGGASGNTWYNRRLEKGRSDFDVRHRWITYATWELPFGKNRKWLNSLHWLANGFLGNWELNVIQTMEQGTPFSFGIAGSPNVYLAGNGVQRADMAAGKTYADIKLPDWNAKHPCRFLNTCADPWADLNAFAYPASFARGNSGRNIQTGPGMLWHQVSIAKEIPIGERLKGRLRFDVNQPFKRYFYNRPNSTVDFRNPQNFGRITGTQGQFSNLGGQYYMMAIFKIEF